MWPFLVIVVLLAINGFFVALEFALVGSRRSRLEPLAESGDRSAIRALAAMKELSIQLAGAQLGITVASLVLGLVGEPAVADLLLSLAQKVSWIPHAWIHPMAAVLGLEDADMEAVCAAAAQGEVVEAVNFNAPGQVVIAGHRTALARAIEGAKAQGAKRALPLAISVPCHSSLMRPAAERLRERLAKSPLAQPQCRFLSSADAQEYRDPEAIRDLLYRQLASPVRWVATVQALVGLGVTRFVECGPGKVLAGLHRRIDKTPGIEAMALEDPASLSSALAGGAA